MTSIMGTCWALHGQSADSWKDPLIPEARVPEDKHKGFWKCKISETFEIFPCERLASPPPLFFNSGYK